MCEVVCDNAGFQAGRPCIELLDGTCRDRRIKKVLDPCLIGSFRSRCAEVADAFVVGIALFQYQYPVKPHNKPEHKKTDQEGLQETRRYSGWNAHPLGKAGKYTRSSLRSSGWCYVSGYYRPMRSWIRSFGEKQVSSMGTIEQFALAIKEGYTFKGESIILGGALMNGEVPVDAVVRVPLRTMNRHG